MKISIIIPTIGRKTLKKVLQSIIDAKGFNENNTEIIVIGDGDFSRDFILEQSTKHQFIKFLSTGKISGASSARNLGIEESTGEIVTFIGDDTYVDSLWLQELRKFHMENPWKNIAMLGQINWTDEFKDKSFYKCDDHIHILPNIIKAFKRAMREDKQDAKMAKQQLKKRKVHNPQGT